MPRATEALAMNRAGTQAGIDELLALRSGVSSGRAPNGDLYLLTSRHAQPLGKATPTLDALLRRLAGPAATDAELLAHLRSVGHDDAVPEPAWLDRILRHLRNHGWLTITVTYDGRPLYTVVPERSPAGRAPVAVPSELVLSRFALIRRAGNELVMESPRAWCHVRIHSPAALSMVGQLTSTHGESMSPEPLAASVIEQLRRNLWWAGMAVARPGPEDDELRLRQWSSHELWFHDRSRAGWRDQRAGYGGTWWARGVFEPLPARHEPFPGAAVDLYRPDLNLLRTTDPPLTAVLEDRRTVRENDDDAPITADQLGELLYRCARNRGMSTHDGVEYLSRPHPSGGGTYELEVYPVVRRAAGLEPGMYHYDPQGHRLERVCGPNTAVGRLLGNAATASAGGVEPQVLLVVAARFGRVMWKYEGMPYALILKHVGVLYQMIYCVATAMGLAPCGLGGGDADSFAEATGLDPLAESSVGEVMLGSRPRHRAGAG
jgi:SagB-type dehydrogenase family enzyme